MEPQARISTRAFPRLTHREREILKMIVSGCSNQEIAAALSLSVKTIEWHRMNLMRKLDVHKVADLVRIAIQQKII